MDRLSQLLIFEVEDRRFGLLLQNVDRAIYAVDVTPLPQAPEIVLGVIDLHGSIIPVMDTRRRLLGTVRERRLCDQFVIARTSRRRVALVVDETRGILEYSSEALVPVEPMAPNNDLIGGIIRMSDGLLLLQDLDRFLSVDEDRDLGEALRRQSCP